MPVTADKLGQRQVVAGPACGPVPIDVQKHVAPGSVQFTATMSTAARRAAYRETGVLAAPSTWSWISIARRSHGRTPKNASPGAGSSAGPPTLESEAAVRCADHTFSGRMQELLPRLRPGRMAERRAVVAPADR